MNDKRNWTNSLIIYRMLSGIISSDWCQKLANFEIIQQSANTNQPGAAQGTKQYFTRMTVWCLGLETRQTRGGQGSPGPVKNLLPHRTVRRINWDYMIAIYKLHTSIWNLDIIIVQCWEMFKRFWEKVKGRNLLKVESHCDIDIFK